MQNCRQHSPAAPRLRSHRGTLGAYTSVPFHRTHPGHAAILWPKCWRLPDHTRDVQAVPGWEMLSQHRRRKVLWAHHSCMPGSVLEELPQGSAARELQGVGYKQNKSLWLSPTSGTWYFFFSDLHFCWLKRECRSPGLTSICISHPLRNDIKAWNPAWHNAGADCWLQLALLSA